MISLTSTKPFATPRVLFFVISGGLEGLELCIVYLVCLLPVSFGSCFGSCNVRSTMKVRLLRRPWKPQSVMLRDVLLLFIDLLALKGVRTSFLKFRENTF